MNKSVHIFSLNTEYGKYSKTLIPFIKNIANEVDVFCFQEVPKGAQDRTVFEVDHDPNLYEKLIEILPDYIPYYTEFVKDSFGIVTFVRRNLEQKYRDSTYIFGNSDKPFLDKGEWNSASKALCVKVEGIDIVNLHGVWQPGTKKLDTPDRIRQSKIICKFTKGREHKTVLIGDFNLMPETKSVQILEKIYINLIEKYHITSTRTAVYDKKQKYADYAFTGKDIEVVDFFVQLEPIFSDHGFMLLDVKYR